MLTKRDRNEAYKKIEKLQRLRAANVRKCKEAAGGWTELAAWTGLSTNLLIGVAGENPIRSIGERLARRFEIALALPDNWLDEEHL